MKKLKRVKVIVRGLIKILVEKTVQKKKKKKQDSDDE